MLKIVHLITGGGALLLSFAPSLRSETLPYLQQPDAIYLALFGLTNLLLAWFSWRYQDTAGAQAIYWHDNPKLEWTWTLVTGAIMIQITGHHLVHPHPRISGSCVTGSSTSILPGTLCCIPPGLHW